MKLIKYVIWACHLF